MTQDNLEFRFPVPAPAKTLSPDLCQHQDCSPSSPSHWDVGAGIPVLRFYLNLDLLNKTVIVSHRHRWARPALIRSSLTHLSVIRALCFILPATYIWHFYFKIGKLSRNKMDGIFNSKVLKDLYIIREKRDI